MDEDKERGERLLQAEIKKCEMSIEIAKKELQEVSKPKGFFGTTDKKAIAAAEEKLHKLEVYLIDLQAMNGLEFYEYMKGKEKSDNLKNVSGKVLDIAGYVIESVSGVVPVVGIAGKMIGKGLKTLGKSIKKN